MDATQLEYTRRGLKLILSRRMTLDSNYGGGFQFLHQIRTTNEGSDKG